MLTDFTVGMRGISSSSLNINGVFSCVERSFCCVNYSPGIELIICCVQPHKILPIFRWNFFFFGFNSK